MNELKSQHGTDTFKAGNLTLFQQWWQPASGESKGNLVIIHGIAEHSLRYEDVAQELTQHGYGVYTFDLRGHGRSEGKRVIINSFNEYLDDLDIFLKSVQARQPNSPLFLLGHSMGGAIVTLYLISRKPNFLKGVLLSGGALKVGKGVSPLLVRLAKIIAFVAPNAPALKLDTTDISQDPAVVKAYNDDPLIYHKNASAKTGAEILEAIKLIQAGMSTIKLPLLIMHGTADRITDPEGSKQLYAQAASTDKTLKLYDGFYHEILNEPGKAKVKADIVEWLDKHTQ